MSIRRYWSLTSNLQRYFADQLLMPLGVARVVYLDTDVCVYDDLAPLLAVLEDQDERFGGAVAAAARRGLSKAERDRANAQGIKTEEDVVRQHGFTSRTQDFNAGVLALDLVEFCKQGIVDKMLRLLDVHNGGQLLWHEGNEQPPFSIATAKTTQLVDASFNCRDQTPRQFTEKNFQNTKCRIRHSWKLAQAGCPTERGAMLAAMQATEQNRTEQNRIDQTRTEQIRTE